MPSSIPYDPSLVLANIVHADRLADIEAIAALNAPVDAAQDALNSLLSMRRSLDMTKVEMVNLGISVADLDSTEAKLNKDIEASAKAYVDARMAAEAKIQPIRAKVSVVHADMESPVDYVRTQTRSMPLAAPSLNMDVQFFAFDQNSQTSTAFASTISSYIGATTSWMGDDVSTQMSNTAAKQISNQLASHDIIGTLVLSAQCTHPNALLLAPFALNVDKGIQVWNRLYPDDMIKMDDAAAVAEIAAKASTPGERALTIISGVTYGSSFVGMVHVLNSTDTTVSERIENIASTLQVQMDAGAWFEKESGGFGVADTFAKDVKNLLSTQNITSHVTLIAMGIMPSIVAKDVQLAVQQFANFDPKSTMDQIGALSEATDTAQTSISASATAARTGQQMVALKSATIKGVLSALQPLQDGSNRMLDVNSMMTAFEDFLAKAATTTSGVPLNYYLKSITKAELAQMWVAKYLPGKYTAISSDDFGTGGSAGQGSQPAPAPAPAGSGSGDGGSGDNSSSDGSGGS